MATALTTLAAVKTAGNITGSGDDGLLQSIIDAASSYIAVWCSREFGAVTETIVVDGNGRQKLFCPKTPIISMSSLVVNGSVIPPRGGYSPNAFGYAHTDNMILLVGPYSFAEGWQNVEITLTYGYASVPSDLERACIELVLSRYRARQRIDLMSQSMGGESVTFNPDEFSRWARSVLGQYKSVVPL